LVGQTAGRRSSRGSSSGIGGERDVQRRLSLRRRTAQGIDHPHDEDGANTRDDEPGEAGANHPPRYESHLFEGSSRRRPSASVAAPVRVELRRRGLPRLEHDHVAEVRPIDLECVAARAGQKRERRAIAPAVRVLCRELQLA
jgi:hypothetical protein